MKKLFTILALSTIFLVSCSETTPTAEVSNIDTTSVKVDTTKSVIDSCATVTTTAVSTTTK